MSRAIHRWPGIVAALLLVVLALSGAALSLYPAAERLATPQAEAGLSVADLAGRIAASHPGLEQVRRAPSGQVTAYWFDGGTPRAAVIDPATGEDAGSADPDPLRRWLTNLHRSLFLGDAGRIVTALGAGAMLVLALSGAALVARRTGGWRRWFAQLRGPLTGRLHVEIARITIAGLVLSSATALWMTVSTFDLLPDSAGTPAFPTEVSGRSGMDLGAMAALRELPVTDLRSLSLADPSDPTDAHTLKTARGTGYLDQGSGALLAWVDHSGWSSLSETIFMLHTGQGAAVLGLLLGLMALGVPVMAGTGLALWLAARRARPRIRGNAPARQADTVLLVGSEGGSTWSFASTLHGALTAAGQRVHVAPMRGFDPTRHLRAKRFIVLAATYGDGCAPASAKGFLDRLARMDRAPDAPLAVLGFGDRSFPAFCAYAQEVATAAADKGWPQLLPPSSIDRQSPQEFARWGRALGAALGIELELLHQPVMPASKALTLVSRRDYGAEVQAPTAILRFAPAGLSPWQRLTGRGFARWQAGDLLGILPEGSAIPRFYSLASGSRDGFIEIVVRKQPGGLCSGQLAELRPEQAVQGFLRCNPGFRAGRGRAPLILIGAGTGIGPLAGLIRANARRRPVHLFFGLRHANSDFLYREELAEWQAGGRLSRLTTAFSRGERPHHVQDALRHEAAEVARLVREGARVMVCGGRGMAAGVSAALDEILAPAGLTPALLKAEGRYVEDVY